MELKPQRVLELGPENGNNSGTAVFLFRNLVSEINCTITDSGCDWLAVD